MSPAAFGEILVSILKRRSRAPRFSVRPEATPKAFDAMAVKPLAALRTNGSGETFRLLKHFLPLFSQALVDHCGRQQRRRLAK